MPEFHIIGTVSVPFGTTIEAESLEEAERIATAEDFFNPRTADLDMRLAELVIEAVDPKD